MTDTTTLPPLPETLEAAAAAAVRLLREHAEGLKAAHTKEASYGRDWGDEDAAFAAYIELHEVANRLAALAQPTQPALDPEALIRSCVPGGSVCDPQQVADAIRRYLDAWPQGAQAPIDMVLHCPACGKQHIDAPESEAEYTERLHESSWWELGGDKPPRWANEPHRSHLCAGCGHIWRPADVPTNGVASIKTKGKADSPLAQSAQAPAPEPAAWMDPNTSDVIHALRKREWETIFGLGGKVKASTYTVPLYAQAPLMLNGLTEDETNATASVAGLSTAPAQPAPSEDMNAIIARHFPDDPANAVRAHAALCEILAQPAPSVEAQRAIDVFALARGAR